MALQEQVIPISFAQGLDTKTDKKQIAAGKLLSLQNGVFVNPQEIIKRNGYASLATSIVDSPIMTPNITSGNSLGLMNESLTLADNNFVYTYLPSSTSWVTNGIKKNLRLSEASLLSVTNGVAYPSSVTGVSGMKFTYSVNVDNPLVTIGTYSDAVTNSPITQITPIINSANVNYSNTIVFNNSFNVISRIDNGTTSILELMQFLPNFTNSTVLTLTDDRMSAPPLMVATATDIYILYTDSSATLVIGKYDTSYTLITQVTVNPDPSSGTDFLLDTINNELVVVFGSDATSNINIYRYDLSLGFIAVTLSSSASSIGKVAGALNGTEMFVVYELPAPGDSTRSVMQSLVISNYRTAPTVYTAFPTAYNTRLYSGAFSDGIGYYYAVIHLDNVQPTQFIVYQQLNELASFVGKFALNTALQEGPAEGIVKWDGLKLPFLKAIQAQVVDGVISAQYATSEITLSFDQKLSNVTLASNITYVGAISSIYDGEGIAESGYNLFPEISSNLIPNLSHPLSYEWTAIYSWIDFQGNLHRSAPSLTIRYTFTDPLTPSNGSIPVTITGLGVSEFYKYKNVSIELYRTAANGTIFYLVTTVPNNNVGTVTILGDAANTPSDETLVGNQQLYTTGGEIENIGPPATDLITSFKNRIISVNAENPLQWWFSKQVIQGIAVEYSDVLVQNIDQKGGNITALSTMDDKLIFYKTSNIWYVIGDGPSANGLNNNFTYPQIISSDTGCQNQASIVLSPAGLFFQSPKGIYLLGRDLSLNYVGSPVERYNSSIVTSAEMIAGTNQIRFSLDSGIVLVYDYFVHQWSVFTNISAVDSIIYLSNYAYLTSDGIVNEETPGVYADPLSTPISLALTTGWLSFAALQNFQRVKQLLILGESQSATTLSVSLAYDFNSTITQVDNIPMIGSQQPMQYRIFTQLQKCEAIQITLQDAPISTTEGLKLSALAFNIAQKKGPFKMPASSTYG